MEQELAQDTIARRQLLSKDAKPSYSSRTDIGEARIVHTLSGKAKVIVVREQDKKRVGRLFMVLAATVFAAVSWKVWLAAEQRELERQLAAASPIADRMQVSEPAYMPQFVPSNVSPGIGSGASRTQLQAEISKLVTHSRPQRPSSEEDVVVVPTDPLPPVAAKNPAAGNVPPIAKHQVPKADPVHASLPVSPSQPATVTPAPQAKQPSAAPKEVIDKVTAPSTAVESQDTPIDKGAVDAHRLEENQSVVTQSPSGE